MAAPAGASLPLLVASTVVNHFMAFQIDRSEGQSRRWWCIAAVTANLSALGWFKYVGFLSTSGTSLLNYTGLGIHLPLPKVLLPVGISFFTFQAISYVMDIGRRKLHPVGLLDFAVYLSFFPHLLAGPIVRAIEFLPQLRRRIDPRQVDAGLAFMVDLPGPVQEGGHRQLPGHRRRRPGVRHSRLSTAGDRALFGV